MAETIFHCGLEKYYELRIASAPSATRANGENDRLFDREEVQKEFVRRVGDHREALLHLERIHCPACLWLNERRLSSLPGVIEATVSYAGQFARVRWDPSRLALSQILAAVREIGYDARPFDPSHREALEEQASRRDPARLVFAGVLGMMVMNLSLAAYFAGGPDASGRLPLWELFARWGSLVATAALLAYSGQDFFVGAWRDLRSRRAGMDVPIALGLAAAWIGSGWATVAGRGPVYFDAIAMLVFCVLLARAFESRARLRAAAALDRFAFIEPATARRVESEGLRKIAAIDLAVGDRIRVDPGEEIPADGILLEAAATFDEAVLTGESWPRTREPGEEVIAGSVVCDRPALLRVTRSGENSTLSDLRRLLEKGLAIRPPLAQLADRLAGPLVWAVLAAAIATACAWGARGSSTAFPAAVAVLMVTCPCALAVATPIVLTIAAARLARIGVLPARIAGLEVLGTATAAVFDKTGTLTTSSPSLETVYSDESLDRREALAVAAALESSSLHPIARAFRAAASGPTVPATTVRHQGGRGISGIVAGSLWRIGSPAFVWTSAGPPRSLVVAMERARAEGRLVAALADEQGRSALFTFREALRPGALGLVAEMRRAGIRRAALLSGDARPIVQRLGEKLGFDESLGEMSAHAKLEWVRSNANSERVLYVGDGLNDAPTLAASATSISFADAAPLSRLACDFLLLGQDVAPLAAARLIARRARHVLAQNVGWALAYNVLAMPLAALGVVSPWMAALGMSASSLVVVANALRLCRPGAGELLSAENETRARDGRKAMGSARGRALRAE